jgi:hypothetical protein
VPGRADILVQCCYLMERMRRDVAAGFVQEVLIGHDGLRLGSSELHKR